MKRLLILGAGAIAREHAKAARKLAPVPALLVADPGAEARAGFAKEYPEAHIFSSPDELLALTSEEGDVVIVATPPWLHAPQTLAALRTGRHVLCEKPLATSLTDARHMVAAAAAAGRQLHCCSSRFSARPITREIRRRLLAGEIGQNWRVRWQSRSSASRTGIEYQPGSRWFLDRARAGGGCLLDWGCYDVAVWTEIFQPVAITVESAWIGYPRRGPAQPADVRIDVEHQATATLRLHLADGRSVPVVFERSAASHGGAGGEVMQIEGETGALDWDWLDWHGSAIRHHRDSGDGTAVVDQTTAEDDGLFCHDRPLHALAAVLRGQPASPIAGRRAEDCFSVIAAIYRTAETRLPQTIHFAP